MKTTSETRSETAAGTPLENGSAGKASAGLLLLFGFVLALAWANLPWANRYFSFIHLRYQGRSLQSIVNDGLMGLFFFIVGLEIKAEFVRDGLATWRKSLLPLIGAAGGMLVPALIYLWVQGRFHSLPFASRGWAIPVATDIAFALVIFSQVAKGLPKSVRAFLLALAVADDLGAILIVNLFYSQAEFDFHKLLWMLGVLVGFALLARLRLLPEKLYAAFLSLLLLASLVVLFKLDAPCSLSGLLLAFLLPVSRESFQQGLFSPLVSFVLLPVFAFANGGVQFGNVHINDPIFIGAAIGLWLGKPVGIFGASWLAVKTKLGEMPDLAKWGDLFAIALLGGIGFTMSLFIAQLAFISDQSLSAAKLGVFLGSLLAAVSATLFLQRPRFSLR